MSQPRPAQQESALRATARLYQIITLVYSRAGAPVGRDDLALACGCDVRTISRSVELLRGRGIPLEYDEDAHTYTLPAKGWAYPIAPLTPADALALGLARALLAAPGLPHGDALLEALDKADASLPPALRTVRDQAAEAIEIGRPPRDYSRVPFALLWDALARQVTVEIDYYSRSSRRRGWRRVDPYQIGQRRGAYWEMHAWDHARGQIRTFALDQLHGARATDQTFTRRDDAWDDFADAAGVVGGLRGGPAVAVEALFSPEVTPYAQGQAWEEGLTLTALPDGRALLTGVAQSADAMVAELLRWRRHCRVLGGPALRAAMRDELAAVTALYPDEPQDRTD